MPRSVPERFVVAKRTLRFDRFMTVAIRFGGLGIIIAVFGMLLFIVSVVLPLFGNAEIEQRTTVDLGGVPKLVGLDDYSRMPFTYEGGSELKLHDTSGKQAVQTIPVELPEGAVVTAARLHAGERLAVLGTADGQAGAFRVVYEGADETLTASVEMDEFYPIGEGKVIDVDYGGSAEEKLYAAVLEKDGKKSLRTVLLKQKRSLVGKRKVEIAGESDLTPILTGPPGRLLVPSTGDAVLVQSGPDKVDYFFRNDDEMALRQEFHPFGEGAKSTGVASMEWVFGDVSVVFTNEAGEMRIWSLNVPPGGQQRVFSHTKTLPDLPGPATFHAIRHDKKSFLTGSGRTASLRHATTEAVRWEEELDFAPVAAVIDSKSENAAMLGDDGKLRLFAMNDPHPEAGLKAFFGKLWYEGYNEPKYEWQSTSGNQEFEPKLSLMPLLLGTLKGTLWAMAFAVPVALLAAIYTAQFLRPEAKRIVKPLMEIMASLPSVVLGFLAALWLAPLLEHRVPSVLLAGLMIPLSAIAAGVIWARLPTRHRNRLRAGSEWIVFVPVMVLVAWGGWSLGPWVEKLLFGGDFKAWWPRVTGTGFDQRNSLVTGFMMGFAVIPIIFTIAEDSLAAVPPSLTSASSALGASRWQVVKTVVLPVASAGIFSAIMVGFGRAVGETMIVVMATGNTPIMEWNIFNGMRTLSANIAVELPEASVNSTHYRTLFLGALVLFALTFAVNTVAELLRQRLREKYKLA